jgi:hypothetical protein
MQRYNQISGFTLIAILIFLQIFSLLSLYSLSRASLVMRQNNHSWQSHVQQLKAKKILDTIEKISLPKLNQCRISVTSSHILIHKSLSFWKSHGCRVDDGHYFVVEPLEEDACAIIETMNRQEKIAHYYRITLLTISDTLHAAKYFMQSTIVRPENPLFACQDKRHKVLLGRQMRREI